MGINGVSSYANTYTYGNVKNENVKPSKNSEKNYYAGYTMNSANKFKNVSDYSKYLTNKYKCLTPCKNASVLIDRSVMQKACGDEKTAKWLEENLAIMPDVIRNAQKAAISHGPLRKSASSSRPAWSLSRSFGCAFTKPRTARCC